MLACESFEDVCRAFQLTMQHLAEVLSAVEFMDHECMEMAVSHSSGAYRRPFTESHPQYLLLETAGSHAGHDSEKLDLFVERAFEAGLARDGVVAQDGKQQKELWQLREMQAPLQAESVRPRGDYYPYDISAPVGSMYRIVEDLRERVRHIPDVDILGFGHLGDGNLHLGILSQTARPEVIGAIEPYIYEMTAKYGGSISAEHGLGQMKAEEIAYSKGPEAVELMRRLKHALDPRGILNPYKVIP